MFKKSKKKEEEEKLEKKEVSSETTGTVDLMNPPFDPDIPEQKQRHFR